MLFTAVELRRVWQFPQAKGQRGAAAVQLCMRLAPTRLGSSNQLVKIVGLNVVLRFSIQ